VAVAQALLLVVVVALAAAAGAMLAGEEEVVPPETTAALDRAQREADAARQGQRASTMRLEQVPIALAVERRRSTAARRRARALRRELATVRRRARKRAGRR